MMNVSNGKCIRRLSMRSLKAARQRNIIAVISIALTTIMFTALFTIVMSIVNGFEQSNFRQIGGYAHGGFKYLTEEQFNELKDDSLITSETDLVSLNKLCREYGAKPVSIIRVYQG